MSKQSNIRWKQSDDEDLKKAVRNFNDKIRRLEKKNPKKKNALPERVSVQEIKDLVETRQDLKRELNALRRFSKRGAEELVPVPDNEYNMLMTKWQKNEMNRRIGVINRKRNERYKYISEMEAESRNKKLGYTVGDIGMKTVDENALKPMKAFYPTMARKDLRARFKAIRKESKEHFWEEKELRLRNNVMKGIEAGYMSLFPEDTKLLLDTIENMPFKEFYEKFMKNPGEKEVISPKPGQSMDDQLAINIELLKTTWLPNYQSPIEDQVNKVKLELEEKIHSKKR